MTDIELMMSEGDLDRLLRSRGWKAHAADLLEWKGKLERQILTLDPEALADEETRYLLVAQLARVQTLDMILQRPQVRLQQIREKKASS